MTGPCQTLVNFSPSPLTVCHSQSNKQLLNLRWPLAKTGTDNAVLLGSPLRLVDQGMHCLACLLLGLLKQAYTIIICKWIILWGSPRQEEWTEKISVTWMWVRANILYIRDCFLVTVKNQLKIYKKTHILHVRRRWWRKAVLSVIALLFSHDQKWDNYTTDYKLYMKLQLFSSASNFPTLWEMILLLDNMT